MDWKNAWLEKKNPKHIHILYAIHWVRTWISFAVCHVCVRAFWLARVWLAETGRRHTVRQVCLHGWWQTTWHMDMKVELESFFTAFCHLNNTAPRDCVNDLFPPNINKILLERTKAKQELYPELTVLRLKWGEKLFNWLHVETSYRVHYDHLLDPSSVTIPRPSALFCLSNAFKSRTLDGENRGRERESGAVTPRCSKTQQPTSRNSHNWFQSFYFGGFFFIIIYISEASMCISLPFKHNASVLMQSTFYCLVSPSIPN